MKLVIRRELLLFLLVGGLTVLIDFAVYQLLILYWDINISLSKGCAFCTGTLFAYFANRFWTFENKGHSPGSIYRFIPLYSSTLAINIIVNAVILSTLNHIFFINYIAFIAATGCSAVLNFLGMKFFVFRTVSV